MLLKRIILHITSLIVLSSGNEAARVGQHTTACVYPTEGKSNEVTKFATYRTKPPEVGEILIFVDEFKVRMKKLFAGNEEELLCPVPSSKISHEIPPITCTELYPQKLQDILKKLNTKYTDDKAQNELLDYVWKSKVGSRMLESLVEIFHNNKRAKALVKDMWFYHDDAQEVMLFPDVFLGYELHKTDYGKNLKSHEISSNDEAMNFANGILRSKFPYNTSAISWTGNYYRMKAQEQVLTGIKLHPLVQDSMYLAELQVSMAGETRGSRFIAGTTFLYDFVAFTMCWIYRGRLGPCHMPLPGRDNETVDIISIAIESYAEGSTMDDIVLQVHCVGFKIFEDPS